MRIPQLAPAFGAPREALRHFRLLHGSSHTGNSVVTDAQLQRLADGLARNAVERQIATENVVHGPVALRPAWRKRPRQAGRFHHRLQRRLLVEARPLSVEALRHSFRDDGQRGITNHGVRFAAPGSPQRQVALCPVVRQQGINDAGNALRNHERQQGVQPAKNVPEAKRAVVNAVRRRHHLAGGATDPTVSIGDIAGVQQRAVKRRVENLLSARVGIYFDAGKQLLPLRRSSLRNDVEGLAFVHREVATSTVYVHC